MKLAVKKFDFCIRTKKIGQ